MRIYVSNIPFSATDPQFEDLFTPYGQVKSAKLIQDRETGRPRGFGFVEMEDEDAERAIKELNGWDWGGRKIVVQQAQERPPRSGGQGYGGGRGNGGGYGGGGYRGNAGPRQRNHY